MTTAELSLSPRETECLQLVAHGKTNEEIAVALGIAALTVRNTLERTYLKLAVPNRAAAVAVGFRRGLLQ